ncbi:DUF4424 domain-containing protein [Azorhizobium doebereinerae]|uniref:DUF4424 domain-containing protein n=1 Tax=Azorhizobium doebereinerae TaxID=281091 RepID=UPI0003FAAEC2|nr:DUF4424 domain-containing protein [Azorhizobium doebereinerae]
MAGFQQGDTRHIRRRVALAGAALGSLLLAGAPALANDSTAALAAGGLIFVQNDHVQMKSEDLFISEQEVRVRYVFKSDAKEDLRVLVAFPMPDITVSESVNQSIPVDGSDNFLDFRTMVDGKPVTTELEQRAFALDIDRSELLRKLNIPLAPYLAATGKALDALPPAQWQELIGLGLARVDEYDAGKGMERHLVPLWTLKTTFYWTQVFPAGRELNVEHKYRPSVGMSVGTVIGMNVRDNPWVKEEQRVQMDAFCTDQTFLSAVERATKAAGTQGQPAFSDARIHYILKTGANWAGPIGDFKLTVDKGAPENLVSFCGTGVKKVGPTRFEMTAKDFSPVKDLGVLILKPYPKK